MNGNTSSKLGPAGQGTPFFERLEGRDGSRPSLPTRAAELVNTIEARIQFEHLSPGTHLGTKEDLRKFSGVARATVNEAVRILCDRGQVEARPGPRGGIFVATSNPMVKLGRLFLSVGDQATHIGEVIAVRDHLEQLVLSEATLHRTTGDIRELKSCLRKLATNRHAPGDFMDAVWTLHERIAAISPNALLRITYLGLMQSIRESVTAVERTPDSNNNYIDKRIAAHELLVDTVISNDLDRVADAIRAHWIPEDG